MTIGRLAPLALLFAAACFDRGPPVWAPLPGAGGPASAACLHARELRARVPGLLDEGRLDRALRVMALSEGACPAEEQATWAAHVTALAAIGRSAEAVQLADRIARSDRANDADRSAAEAARASAMEHGQSIAETGSRRQDPELFDPAQKRRDTAAALLHRGVAAREAGDATAAKKLCLESWATWHPNPRALIEGGLAAQALGERAEAQRLWDRAAYDDTTAAIRPELPRGAPVGTVATPIAWSPGGRRLAVAGDGAVVVFDAALHGRLRLEAGEVVFALGFSLDESRLFVGLDSGSLRVVDTMTGAVLRDLPGHDGPVRAIAPAPDRDAVATAGDDGTVRLWDAATGRPSRTFRIPGGAPTALAWDLAGTLLAAAGGDGRITIWDTRLAKLQATLPGRAGAVRALAFAPGEAGTPGTLTAVTATETRRHDLAHPRAPGKVIERAASALAASAVTPSAGGGEGVAAYAADRIAVKDLAGAAIDGAPEAAEPGVIGIALAPGARRLAAVYRDRTLRVWPLREIREKGERRAIHASPPLEALAVAAGGRRLAAVAADGTVLVWGVDPPGLLGADDGAHRARALAFAADGHTLAVGFAEPLIQIRDVARDAPGPTLRPAAGVAALAFSPDGARLAAMTDAPSVQLFDAATQASARELHLDGGPGRAVRFSPDGRTVLLAAKDGVTLWDPGGKKGLRFVPFGPDPRDLAFMPDGGLFAVAARDGALLLGRPSEATPAPLATIPVPTQVLGVACANGLIATAEGDRSIGLRSGNGKLIHRFRTPEGTIRGIGFAGPGTVAAALSDGSIGLYRPPSTTALASLRALLSRRSRIAGGMVSSPGGQVDFVGAGAAQAREATSCRIGATLYPFDVCADHFQVPGMLGIVLAGKDPAEAEP
jgi:WD40 repeat protein